MEVIVIRIIHLQRMHPDRGNELGQRLTTRVEPVKLILRTFGDVAKALPTTSG